MTQTDLHVENSRPLRPWWREPMAIAFGVFVVAASVLVMCRGWTPPPVDPVGLKAVVPGGGSFCDTATRAQGTLVNPSTQLNQDEHRTSNVEHPTSK